VSTLPEPADRARLRVSDADREQAAETLRRAAGDGRITLTELDERLELTYAARTYGDLDAVIADLPGPGVSSHLPDPAGPFPAGRIGGAAAASFSVAIMSGANRTGGWVVPPRYTALALMGGVELDLRQARFSEPEVTIVAIAVMGGISIIAGDDVDLDVSGFGFMGGFDHRAGGPGTPGAPRVRVTGFALMGGVDVRRKPAAAPAAAPGTDPQALPDQPRRGIEG
jgi:hypothetical protein